MKEDMKIAVVRQEDTEDVAKWRPMICRKKIKKTISFVIFAFFSVLCSLVGISRNCISSKSFLKYCV